MDDKEPVCPECGSPQVFREAIVAWDIYKQDWTPPELLPSLYCRQCEHEFLLPAVKWKEVRD